MVEYDEDYNPYWMHDKDLGKGPVDVISQEETLFFKVGLTIEADPEYGGSRIRGGSRTWADTV